MCQGLLAERTCVFGSPRVRRRYLPAQRGRREANRNAAHSVNSLLRAALPGVFRWRQSTVTMGAWSQTGNTREQTDEVTGARPARSSVYPCTTAPFCAQDERGRLHCRRESRLAAQLLINPRHVSWQFLSTVMHVAVIFRPHHRRELTDVTDEGGRGSTVPGHRP
jgi:hypothetical protein